MNTRASIISRIVIGLLATAILASCGDKTPQTSAELPYSVLVQQYESLGEATETAERLNELDIPAYVLKKVQGDNNFTMDVHAGAFEEKQAASELEAKLHEMGLPKAQVVEFINFREDLSEYEQLEEAEKQEFTLEETKIPDLPEKIVENLKAFPVNDNFRIISLVIYDNSESTKEIDLAPENYADFSVLPESISTDFVLDTGSAATYAVYEDKLFGYSLGITILSTEDSSSVLQKIEEEHAGNFGTLISDEEQFITEYGTLSGSLYKAETDADPMFTYVAEIEDSGHVMLMTTKDCPEEQYINLINSNNEELGILFFPEIRRNLYILPKPSDEQDMKFAFFTLDKIKPEYAEERENEEWAKAIVGNWSSTGYFNFDGRPCIVYFFDLIYVSTAENVHKIFVDIKIENEEGEKVQINENKEGYYDEYYSFNELSFSQGSYIIAINSTISDKVLLEEMLALSNNLQIWERKED